MVIVFVNIKDIGYCVSLHDKRVVMTAAREGMGFLTPRGHALLHESLKRGFEMTGFERGQGISLRGGGSK